MFQKGVLSAEIDKLCSDRSKIESMSNMHDGLMSINIDIDKNLPHERLVVLWYMEKERTVEWICILCPMEGRSLAPLNNVVHHWLTSWGGSWTLSFGL